MGDALLELLGLVHHLFQVLNLLGEGSHLLQVSLTLVHLLDPQSSPTVHVIRPTNTY